MTQLLITEDDKEELDSNFPSCWEYVTLDGGTTHGIIISDYLLPDDIYTTEKTDLMVMVPTGYPMSQMDMFYCDPGMERKDGRPINGLNQETHFGRHWQRWSRHYVAPNVWDPGTHSVMTHLLFVKNLLLYDQ